MTRISNPQKLIAKSMSERELQDNVVELAQHLGWLVHAERPAWTEKGYRTPIQGNAGFPDLVLANYFFIVRNQPQKVLFVELKSEMGELTMEGSIGLNKFKTRRKDADYYNYTVSVQVSNTNQWLCEYLHFNFGGYLLKNKFTKPQHKDSWHWQIVSHRAQEFLVLILPYLRIKKPQAELAIEVCKHHLDYVRGKRKPDEAIALSQAEYILMRKMNRRGKIIER